MLNPSQINDQYQYLSIVTCKQPIGEWYQLRLVSALGRKTIGLGSDKILALQIARLVDDRLKELIASSRPVDIDDLKAIVKLELDKKRTKFNKTIRLVQKDDLSQLWKRYVDFHIALGSWEQTYILCTIKTITSIVQRCPYQKLEEKPDLFQWVLEENPKRSIKTSKDRLKLIVASIDWCSKQGIIDRNYGIEWRDTLNSINIKSTNRTTVVIEGEDDCNSAAVDIFSVKEVYSILEVFKNNTHSRFKGKHSQYYFYVYFCWLTGCRPSEAIALKWENVDIIKKRIKFCEGFVNASGTIVERKSTKTQPYRYFPVNEELHNLLLESSPHRSGHVFRNDKGKPITQQAFRRVWIFILNAMGLRYRIPYNLRHTMISYHANNDYPLHKLAELVGNSETVIKNHYLRLNIEKMRLPDVLR